MNNYICTIAKNEDLYLKEWLDYHFLYGFDKICIYDNNDDQRIYKEQYIIDYLILGKLEIIHWTLNQLNAYENFITTHEYDWVLFIDIDEFFDLGSKYDTLEQYLSSSKDYNVIIFPWRIYDANQQLYYDNKPVLERFNRLANVDRFSFWSMMFYYSPAICKSFISRKCDKKSLKFYNVHVPKGSNCKYTLNTLDGSDGFDNYQFLNRFNYDYPYIKHICFKSFQEFYSRMELPKPDSTIEDHYTKYNCKINNFFEVNDDLNPINDIVICKNIESQEENLKFEKDFINFYNDFIKYYSDKIIHIHIRLLIYSSYNIPDLLITMQKILPTKSIIALDKNDVLQQLEGRIKDDSFILFIDDLNKLDYQKLVDNYLKLLDDNSINIITLNNDIYKQVEFKDYLEFYNFISDQIKLINQNNMLIKYSFFNLIGPIRNIKNELMNNDYSLKIQNANQFFFIEDSDIISLFGEDAYYFWLTYINNIEF